MADRGAPLLSMADTAPDAHTPAALHEELTARLARRPIVCFANDWNGDPTSKHHIMRTLADHTEVVWVESSGMRRPDLSAADLRRISQKIRRAGERAPAVNAPLRVVSPLALPLPGSRVAEALNARLYRRALDRVGAFRDPTRPPLLWLYIPTVAPYLPRLPGNGIVYHCVDRWWAFGEYDEQVMRRHHAELCRRADIVFASAAELVQDCAQYSDRVHLIRHGVDWDHFARAALERIAPPPDIADIEGPIIGFFGLIHDWIDQDLLARVADTYPHATIVLIGKTRVDVSELARRPNVRLVGQKRYDDLPAYAAHFDVALIPFVVNELTRAVNPIKLREYLSAGVRVVSTDLPEMAVYETDPRVRIAHDEDQFVASIGELIARPDDQAERQAAAQRMVEESWLGRCATMIRLLDETLEQKGRAAPDGVV